MLKVLKSRIQQYMNRELPDIKAGFRKVSGTRDQLANILWISEKARESRKTSTSDLDFAKCFGSVNDNKLWKSLEKMQVPDLFNCLLRKP